MKINASVLLVECPACGELCSVVGQVELDGTPYLSVDHPEGRSELHTCVDGKYPRSSPCRACVGPDRRPCVAERPGVLGSRPIATMWRRPRG